MDFFKEVQCQLSLEAFWNNKAEKTKILLGPKTSSFTDSPLGNFFTKKFPNYNYRKEDGSVDLSIYKMRFYKNIFNLYDPEDIKFKVHDLSTQPLEYPIFYDILVEHENVIELCYQEMIKLTNYRSKLKVLITYNWDKSETSDYRYVYETVPKNFKDIILQSNQECQEVGTEYLLIIGQRVSSENVEWKKYIIKR